MKDQKHDGPIWGVWLDSVIWSDFININTKKKKIIWIENKYLL
jgi:hypothetical protein